MCHGKRSSQKPSSSVVSIRRVSEFILLRMIGVLPVRTYSPSGDEKKFLRNTSKNSQTPLFADRKE